MIIVKRPLKQPLHSEIDMFVANGGAIKPAINSGKTHNLLHDANRPRKQRSSKVGGAA